MFCSPLSVKFADHHSIRAKSDSPCQTNDFINHENSSFFKADIAEVYIFDLSDTNGGLVDSSWSSWFQSSRKKDTIIVATLLGIV